MTKAHPGEPPRGEEIAAEERRLVLHPRTAAARRHGRKQSRGGFVRGHPVDDQSVQALISQQRRQAMVAAVVLLVPLFALPAIFAWAPDVAAWRPLGVPSFAWVVLSPGVFPLFVALGRWQERRSDMIEERWIEANR